MIFEVILLALASTVRPTSLAAVTALLGRESSRRLMIAYVAGGLIFAFVFGVVVVGVFHGIHVHAGSDRTKAVADVVGGVAALLFGVAVLVGLVPLRDGGTSRSGAGGWMSRLDRRITVRVAAFAGPLTHIPGAFYLIALNVIVAHNPYIPGGVVAVAVYDAIWFAVPIAALLMCIVDPGMAQGLVIAVQRRTTQHSRTIVLATCFVVGVALLVRGLLHL
jgi:cytochrome bd-type quinol oxidase subunit 2